MARIILVDDDRLFARLVQARLSADGHQVDWHEGAFGALTQIRRGSYDVVLMDVQMPGIDGPALLGCLDSRSVGRARVVLMSSIAEDRLRCLAREKGADAYFPKRHHIDRLAAMIGRWTSSNVSGSRPLTSDEPYELRRTV
ncbi:MAG: response regulator [Polyangiaceae bacterium]|nr:response regulator [Polyangiaceae bacterium]